MAGNAAHLERETRKNQLLAPSRFNGARDRRIVEGVHRGTIGNWDAGQSFDQLGNCRSPHAVPGRRCHDDRELERLSGFGEADDIMGEFRDRVVTHPAHQPDLMVNQDEGSVLRSERFIRTDVIRHDCSPDSWWRCIIPA